MPAAIESVLIDTCTFLWAISSPGDLSEAARSTIAKNDVQICVSVASLWELCLKRNKGKLLVSDSDLQQGLRDLQSTTLAIFDTDVFTMNGLEESSTHKDPFDRIIVAQALNRKLPLVSKDRKLRAYDKLHLIW